MLLAYNKHYIGNFKYFLISNYLFTFKQLFFNKIIYVSLKFSKKTFFLATFLLYCFCNLKFKFLIKKKEYNILLPTIYFIYFFNIFLSYSLNINFFKTDFKHLIFLNFKIKNILLVPSSYLFIFKKYKWFKFKNNITLKIKFILFSKLIKYFFFYINFFQIPIFNNLKNKNDKKK
jgi:hypothetical protein